MSGTEGPCVHLPSQAVHVHTNLSTKIPFFQEEYPHLQVHTMEKPAGHSRSLLLLSGNLWCSQSWPGTSCLTE